MIRGVGAEIKELLVGSWARREAEEEEDDDAAAAPLNIDAGDVRCKRIFDLMSHLP